MLTAALEPDILEQSVALLIVRGRGGRSPPPPSSPPPSSRPTASRYVPELPLPEELQEMLGAGCVVESACPPRSVLQFNKGIARVCREIHQELK